MKRWLIVLGLLVAPAIALANWLYLPGPGYSRAVSESFTCSSTPYRSNAFTTSQVALGTATNRWYYGRIIESGQTPESICATGFYVKTVIGDVSNQTYVIQVYALGANDELATLKATSSTINGSTITGGMFIDGSFTTLQTISPGDAIVISRTDSATLDGSNYINIGTSPTADSDSGWSYFGRWNQDNSLFTTAVYDLGARDYAAE